MLALQPEIPSSQGIDCGRQQQSPRNGEPLTLAEPRTCRSWQCAAENRFPRRYYFWCPCFRRWRSCAKARKTTKRGTRMIAC